MPAVAAMITGLPAIASFSSTSKNILNSPLYEALKIGVATIKASARTTDWITWPSCALGKAGQHVVRDVVRVVAQLHHLGA